MKLETARLTLREFVPEDWKTVLAYQSDPRYLQYYAWTSRSADEVQEFVQRQVENQSLEPRIKFQLAVVLKSEGRLIGNCGVRKDAPEATNADIGYELNPDYWGQGFATEAAHAVLAFGFTKINVHRIWAHCLADNTRSWRVLEKLGMRLEGHLREVEFYKGRWWDTLIYAVLKDEWRASKQTRQDL